MPACGGDATDAGARVVDFNQDGMQDILILGRTTTGAESARILQSNGAGFDVKTPNVACSAATIMSLILDHVTRQSATLVLVTHDEEIARRHANRIVRMRDGHIEEG